MLVSLPFVDVIGSTRSPKVASEIILEQKPDVLVLSADTSASDVELLLAAGTGLGLLVLIRSDAPDHLSSAARLPARVFLMEEDLTADTLATGLRSVALGHTIVPPVVANHLLEQARSSRKGTRRHSLPMLTAREQQVLQLLASGLGTKQTAHRLGISGHTVKRYVANILGKLSCTNRTMAVARAIELQLVPNRVHEA